MNPVRSFAMLVGLFCFCSLWTTQVVSAQSVEVKDEKQMDVPLQNTPAGKEKAGQYFQTRKTTPARAPQEETAGPAPRYLAMHLGGFFTDQAYRWGDGEQKNVGRFNAGVTYRLGEWVNSMDFAVRIEYTSYSLNEQDARKLSIAPLLTFPDANSRFPIYFGGGLGLGMFIKQIKSKSPLSLDWQLVVGVRFLNLFNRMGLMLETGLKNHVFLLSDGQLNGVFINVGTVFMF